MAQGELSEVEVRRLAKLARLEVGEAEVASLRRDLSAVLGYFERLRAVEVGGVDADAGVAITRAELGSDEPGAMLSVDALMAMAPRAAPPFVEVPKVLGEGGGA